MFQESVLLAALMWAAPVVSGTDAAAAAQMACGTGLLGDVTDDDAVNTIDAQQIARWSIGLPVSATVESRISTHGDATGDGNVNTIDAQQIARWSIGLSTTFPIGEPLPACEGIRVTTATTGEDLDDGYEVLVDGLLEGTIGVNGALDVPDAEPGGHTVTLQDLASNCAITNGDATRSVTVVEGEAAFVEYEVECTATGQGGTLRVENTTTGTAPTGPYPVSLDGGTPRDMPVDGSVTFEGISVGSHTVTIGNLGSCTADGGATKTVEVESGLNILHFLVDCPGEDSPEP